MKMEHSEWAGNFAYTAGQEGLAFAVASGVKKTTISQEEKEKMMLILKSMTGDWLKQNTARGLPAQEWLDEFNRLLKKYNAQY